MTNAGTLSVLVPNFNHGRCIGDALERILGQSRRPDEVIVLDDGSTDDSVDVIESIARRDPVVRFLRSDRNQGVTASARRLLEEARGEFLVSAAADDRILPGFFERSMRLLALHPEAGLTCADQALFDDATGVVTVNRMPWGDSQPRYLSPDELAASLRGRFLCGNTSVIRRDALLAAGGFDPRLRWHTDWFAFHVVAFRRGVCYLPGTVSELRVHAGTYSGVGKTDPAAQSEVLGHAIRLLQSPAYRDVLPRFQRSSAMAHFGLGLLRSVLVDPGLWNRDTFRLVRSVPIARGVSEAFRARVPAPARRLYRRLRSRSV